MNKFHYYIYLTLIATLSISSCTIPKFTQGSSGLAPDEKSINITEFKNNATRGTSNMHVVFTQKTQDYFQQNTKLEIVEGFSDI